MNSAKRAVETGSFILHAFLGRKLVKKRLFDMQWAFDRLRFSKFVNVVKEDRATIIREVSHLQKNFYEIEKSHLKLVSKHKRCRERALHLSRVSVGLVSLNQIFVNFKNRFIRLYFNSLRNVPPRVLLTNTFATQTKKTHTSLFMFSIILKLVLSRNLLKAFQTWRGNSSVKSATEREAARVQQICAATRLVNMMNNITSNLNSNIPKKTTKLLQKTKITHHTKVPPGSPVWKLCDD